MPTGSEPSLEEETEDGVFCRPGCLDERDARLCRNPRRCGHSRGESADAVPWLEPAWITRRLCREPAGLSGAEVVATHKTDRNDARGLAHLARTGFFKLVHVKSLSAHAVRSLIIARKKLVGQRVTLENQIRGLAVVFGVRLPCALNPAFIRQALRASEGIPGLSAAMQGLAAARAAVLAAVGAIDADTRRMVRASEACRRLMSIPGVGEAAS
jgi:hypothetical protein